MPTLMRFLAIICLSGLLLTGGACHPDKSPVLQTIDLTQDINKEKPMMLSDIATDIRYIKLKGSKECYIQALESSAITEDYILIVDQMSNKIFLFSMDGKFLHEISRFGKGPGEHIQHPRISFDTKGTSIYVLSNKKIDIFSLSGELTGTIRVDPTPDQAIGLGDQILLAYPYPSSFRNDGYHFTLIDKQGNVIRKFFQWEQFKADQNDPNYASGLARYGDTLLYRNMYSDTLYGITKEMKVVKRWLIKQRNNQDPQHSGIKETGYYPSGFNETPDYMFIGGYINKMMHPVIFDKRTHEITYYPYDMEIYGFGLVNDLDGGVPFWLGRYKNGKSYSFDYPSRMKELISKSMKRNTPVKFPDKKQKLIELMNSIIDEDNQILTIVTLK